MGSLLKIKIKDNVSEEEREEIANELERLLKDTTIYKKDENTYEGNEEDYVMDALYITCFHTQMSKFSDKLEYLEKEISNGDDYMRLNQLSLKITRYGKQVPKGYPEDRMVVDIYADSNNLYEALSKLQAKAINVMEQWERVGARCDITERRGNINHPISEKLLVRRYDKNRK